MASKRPANFFTYRYKGQYGWIHARAPNATAAVAEVARSISSKRDRDALTTDSLEIYDDAKGWRAINEKDAR